MLSDISMVKDVAFHGWVRFELTIKKKKLVKDGKNNSLDFVKIHCSQKEQRDGKGGRTGQGKGYGFGKGSLLRGCVKHMRLWRSKNVKSIVKVRL